MRVFQFLLRITIISALAISTLTGCRHPPAPKQGGDGSGLGSGAGQMGGITPLDSTGVGMTGGRPAGTWGQHGEFEPVYFEFDSALVRPSELPKLQAVANALRGNNKKLIIEGHCDERGTAEYNRALGERRALACREELIRLGIAADRITTISYGEDRPAVIGHDESAWSKNRRCEFITVSP
ncbi:MAG: OmpA family protein [Verrucomicrobiae bacterium]|nr:OmpA family protein [Verrucomicrobiae bacterium]